MDLGQELGHFHVGQEHEIFDQLVGLLHALDDHAKRLARLVELEAALVVGEHQGTARRQPSP